MASLNASAILAASYEIENYMKKQERLQNEAVSYQSTTSDSEKSDEDAGNDEQAKNSAAISKTIKERDSDKEKEEPPTTKKEKKDVKMELEEVIKTH